MYIYNANSAVRMRDASGGQQDFCPAIGSGLKILASLSKCRCCRGDRFFHSQNQCRAVQSLRQRNRCSRPIDAEFISKEVCAEKYKPKMKQNQNAGVI